jgi:hypothetical protein
MKRLWLAILGHWRRNQHPRIRIARRAQRTHPWRLF